MRVYHFPENPEYTGTYASLVTDLLDAPVIHTGEWQSIDTTGSKAHGTHELEDVTLRWDQAPDTLEHIVPAIDFPWAADHFLERVSGRAFNPAPSAANWPYAVRANADHTDTTGEYDHTYPERFWPQHTREGTPLWAPHKGIRFDWGDLGDVVGMLARSPLTRQAFLPVWFPEDTGATHGQRVPCTIGYHFMQRGGKLSCRYYIRSVDVYRHLSNDIYMAANLVRWVCLQVRNTTDQKIRFNPGALTMHIASLHAFVADVPRIKTRLDEVIK